MATMCDMCPVAVLVFVGLWALSLPSSPPLRRRFVIICLRDRCRVLWQRKEYHLELMALGFIFSPSIFCHIPGCKMIVGRLWHNNFRFQIQDMLPSRVHVI